MTEDDFEYVMHVPQLAYCDLLDVLKAHPDRMKYRDYYCLALHLLAANLNTKFKEIRQTSRSPKEWYASMSSVLFHEMMGNIYVHIIRDLEAWGFIWRSKSYVVSKPGSPGKCKAFSFCSKYAKFFFRYLASREEYYADSTGTAKKFGRSQRIKIKNRLLYKRMKVYMKAVKTFQMTDDMVSLCHSQLKDHFHIDSDKAEQVISGMERDGTITARAAREERRKVKRFNGAGNDSLNLYVKKDDYGRIHTNITNLKKEIRRDCLRCDGKPVVAVDIKSSQGAFLCAILANFSGDGDLYVKDDPFLEKAVDHCKYMDRVLIHGEYMKYHGLLESRRLYEFFAEKLSEDLDIDRPVDRSEAKKEFLAMLFAPIYIDWRKHPLRAAVRRVWEDEFPLLLRCLDEMKRGSYASLARLMQRVESHFVFGMVIPDIVREVGCPFCTVHDSVDVPEEYGDRVKAIMDRDLANVHIPTATEQEYAVIHPDIRTVRFSESISDELYGNDGAAELL